VWASDTKYFGVETHLLLLSGFKQLFLGRSARGPVIITIKLF